LQSGQSALYTVLVQHLLSFLIERIVGNHLIDLAEIGHMNHRVATKFGAVGDDDHLAGALDHGAKRLDNEAVGITETGFCYAHDPHDEDVGRDGVKHAFADRSELHAKAGVKIASSERDFNLLRFPENFSNRYRIRDHLNRPVAQVLGHFNDRRSAS
jgi:hypothetical protein